MPFHFESLDVYKKSLDWVEAVDKLTTSLKGQISYGIVDQITRAALSIPLNIAEGNGRWHKAEKKNFFWIARGSVYECVAIIQVLQRKQVFSTEDYGSYYSLLESLAQMLSKLVQATEKLER